MLDAHREIALLFTDVGLPGGMNGRQLADETQRRRSALKVLFISGYARMQLFSTAILIPALSSS
jgi:CheY-like chemotaxis protein